MKIGGEQLPLPVPRHGHGTMAIAHLGFRTFDLTVLLFREKPFHIFGCFVLLLKPNTVKILVNRKLSKAGGK